MSSSFWKIRKPPQSFVDNCAESAKVFSKDKHLGVRLAKHITAAMRKYVSGLFHNVKCKVIFPWQQVKYRSWKPHVATSRATKSGAQLYSNAGSSQGNKHLSVNASKVGVWHPDKLRDLSYPTADQNILDPFYEAPRSSCLFSSLFSVFFLWYQLGESV